MRILVMQTTRMGDVLQTTPLIRALRRKYPDAHIACMVRNMGKAVALRNPDINEVLVHEEDAMYLDMRSDDSVRFLRAYRTAEAQIARLRDARYDVAYNCTHSIASSMLLKLAGIPKVVGAHLSDDWQYVLRGRWINYFYTSVFHREYNDLNLCDISQRFLDDAEPQRHLVLETHEEDEAFVDDLLCRHGIAPSDFIVCMQLGASEESKRWAEVRFAGLARLLAGKYDARILLVGVREEAHLGQAFELHAPGIATHLYGETSVPQLAALLKRARLLVTNDTGTMHIAAAVDCKVLLVSVGFVHFRETGPYGEGHCAIEWRRAHIGRADNVPGGLDERMLIQPEQSMCAVEYLLEHNANETIRQMDETPEMAQVDLYTTRFASDGCLAWYPVLRRPLTERDLLRIAYRAMWIEHLSGSRSSYETPHPPYPPQGGNLETGGFTMDETPHPPYPPQGGNLETGGFAMDGTPHPPFPPQGGNLETGGFAMDGTPHPPCPPQGGNLETGGFAMDETPHPPCPPQGGNLETGGFAMDGTPHPPCPPRGGNLETGGFAMDGTPHPPCPPQGGNFEAGGLSLYATPDPDLVNVRGPQLAGRFEQLAALARRGIEWTEDLLVCLKRTHDMKRARQMAAELARLDEEIRVFSEVHSCCKPLALIARYERDNLEGSDPLNLAETTLNIYKDCETRALLMQKKLLALLQKIGNL